MARKNISAQISKAITQLFYQDGIQQTGVDPICLKAKVSKMSMYKYFGSKDGLIMRYLAIQIDKEIARAKEVIAKQSEPATAILALFDDAKSAFDSPSYRGCPLQNATAELSDENHPGHALILDCKDNIREMIEEQLLLLNIKRDDAIELSFNLQSLLEGAKTMTSIHNFPEPLTRAKRYAATTIKMATSC